MSLFFYKLAKNNHTMKKQCDIKLIGVKQKSCCNIKSIEIMNANNIPFFEYRNYLMTSVLENQFNIINKLLKR